MGWQDRVEAQLRAAPHLIEPPQPRLEWRRYAPRVIPLPPASTATAAPAAVPDTPPVSAVKAPPFAALFADELAEIAQMGERIDEVERRRADEERGREHVPEPIDGRGGTFWRPYDNRLLTTESTSTPAPSVTAADINALLHGDDELWLARAVPASLAEVRRGG